MRLCPWLPPSAWVNVWMPLLSAVRNSASAFTDVNVDPSIPDRRKHTERWSNICPEIVSVRITLKRTQCALGQALHHKQSVSSKKNVEVYLLAHRPGHWKKIFRSNRDSIVELERSPTERVKRILVTNRNR